MKEELTFLVTWEKDKKRTWSGTCWGLYNSLSNFYKITDYDLRYQPSLLERIGKKMHIISDGFGTKDILRQRKKLSNHLSGKTVFQFSEIIDNTNQPIYIYQDLNVSYVRYMYQNLPQIFKVSNFKYSNIHDIKQREELQNNFYKNCTGIFTMGKWLEKYLTEQCNIPSHKVHHVGGGINLNADEVNDSFKENNKILFIGRDFERKGGYIIYNAFKKLKEEIPNLELYVAGPSINPIGESIKGYHWYGDCSHEELSKLFNKCDIFCMPSYFEAYGLVFIEALTYGLPCLGRNAYEMPYFIQDGETGLLIEDDNLDEVVRKIKKLLTCQYFKDNVRRQKEWYIKEYSWETVAQRIKNIINKEKEYEI